jgi:hypothetical protein
MNDLRAWLVERLPRDEDLDRPELARLAVAIGQEPGLWRSLVCHDPDARYFNQLYHDPHVDVWLICWVNRQDTGYHDHDQSSGAVYVVEGMLCEDYFYRDDDGWIRELTHERRTGEAFDFDGSYIHGVRHPGGPPATSIHVYSPALWRMGHYEPGALGVGRRPITYADELS